ncbi:MAG: hypothetical protein K5891_00720 [Lachnospiraceae bacterium]|nr:hypothetical protein [Lachnospiraceae bacterium]
MAEVRLIGNLKGRLYYLDSPLLDFEIRDRELVKATDLSGGKLYPWEMATQGVSYGSFVRFFDRRTMQEGCMYYFEHLRALGMERMDFDRYIRLNNGNNHLDNYWVRFEDGGARCFAELK